MDRPRVQNVQTAMIVCSCNVLTDHDVRTAVNEAAPQRAGEVYGCLGCSAQCGRCARTIKRIMDEALGTADQALDTADEALSMSCPIDCACSGSGAR